MTNKVSEAVIGEFTKLSTTLCLDILKTKGYLRVWMKGVKSLMPGARLAGRAVTVRFLPTRPDLVERLPQKEASAEYRAIERCGPGDVLVMDALGFPYDSVGGDIKFLRLKMRQAAGVVTDGAIRDIATVRGYGLALFAQNATPKAGPTDILPFEENVPIQCGGVTVWPGDVIVGDDDGVVVIPAQLAEEVARLGQERAEVEAFIKARLQSEDVSPGVYYPIDEATLKKFRAGKGTW